MKKICASHLARTISQNGGPLERQISSESNNVLFLLRPSVNNTVSFLSGLRSKRGRDRGTEEAVMLALEGDDDERPKTNIGSLTDRACETETEEGQVHLMNELMSSRKETQINWGSLLESPHLVHPSR